MFKLRFFQMRGEPYGVKRLLSKYTNHLLEFAIRNLLFFKGLRVVNSGAGSVYFECDQGGYMLKEEYVRDGKNRIIGSVTTGYEGAFESIVRDEHEQITGRTSERFATTRDEHGRLVSTNTADAGLLINRKK